MWYPQCYEEGVVWIFFMWLSWIILIWICCTCKSLSSLDQAVFYFPFSISTILQLGHCSHAKIKKVISINYSSDSIWYLASINVCSIPHSKQSAVSQIMYSVLELERAPFFFTAKSIEDDHKNMARLCEDTEQASFQDSSNTDRFIFSNPF